MRKLVTMAAGLALATTVFAAVPASADPAVVIRPGGLCGMPGADADGNITFGGVGVVTHVVQNDNHLLMTCKGQDITNLSGRGQHFSGFDCGVVPPVGKMVWTTGSHATVSKSGKATLTCKVALP